MAERGKFIAIEGPDGNGKTTQAALLYAYLRDLGIPTVAIQEPGGTDFGNQIRHSLLKSEIAGKMGYVAEALLFYSTRTQLLNEIVAPALARGDILVADRFEESSWVFQGIARGIGTEKIETLSALTTQRMGCVPDLYINLDMPVEVAIARLNLREDESTHFDRQTMDFHQLVRDSYRKFARLSNEGVLPFAPRVVEIDGNREIEVVQKDVRDVVEDLLGVKANV